MKNFKLLILILIFISGCQEQNNKVYFAGKNINIPSNFELMSNSSKDMKFVSKTPCCESIIIYFLGFNAINNIQKIYIKQEDNNISNLLKSIRENNTLNSEDYHLIDKGKMQIHCMKLKNNIDNSMISLYIIFDEGQYIEFWNFENLDEINEILELEH